MPEMHSAYIRFGTYRLSRADKQYDSPTRFVCTECKSEITSELPLLEVTRTTISVYMSCPNCGSAVSLASGAVQRILCVPSNDPESI